MAKSKYKSQPSVSFGQAFGAAALWFAVGAVPTLLLAVLFSALGNVGFFPPILIFGPLFAGLAMMGLVAVSQEWAWFFQTPIARHWIGLFGERIGRVVLRIMLAFLLLVGVGTAFVPLIAPAPKAQAGGAEVARPPGGAAPQAANDPPQAPATMGMSAADAGFLAAALKDLRSGRRDHQQNALMIIQVTWRSPDRPAELRREVVKLLDTADPFVPSHAARALGTFGTAEDLPTLEKALSHAKDKKDFGFEIACKDAIDQIKMRK